MYNQKWKVKRKVSKCVVIGFLGLDPMQRDLLKEELHSKYLHCSVTSMDLTFGVILIL